MFPINVKATEQVALLDSINPVSQGVGTVTTGWVSAAQFNKFLATVICGVLGAAATVDAKIQQANTSGGGGAKDVAGTPITQLVKATNDNNQALINVDAQQLDVANGFAWIRLSITVGAAASLVSGQLFGFIPRNASADALNNATVVQVVN
jgi:hypothetical protein